jgi:pimeloyl-ACP methyl ester carboxylesterase
MVAALPGVADPPSIATHSDFPLAGGYSEMPTPNVTCLLDFQGDDVQQVLASRSATLRVFDPLLDSTATIKGETVPLAANFTAGYGVWLARSNFASEAIRTLLDMDRSLDKPHLYMLQPFDPNRRVVLMLHGLASSPEAWVNTANDVLGDEELRARYQVWLVYYPTNLPLPYNHQAIRQTVLETLRGMDPSRTARASQEIVVVGHSMGGLLTRLMVSSSDGSRLLDRTLHDLKGQGEEVNAVREELAPLLEFDPMPEVRRAVFIATPHRGTPSAEGMLAAIVSRFSSIPQGLSTRYSASAAVMAAVSGRLPLSIDNLKESDAFVKDTASLSISPNVAYHSIIAVKNPTDLAIATDGFVPYRSAHLDGASSEKIIISGHSVQQTPKAILELRRILRMDAGLETLQSD